MSRTFATARQGADVRLRARAMTHTLSAARFNLRRTLEGVFGKYVAGQVLDVGAGLSPYSDLISNHASHVTIVDVEDRSGGVDLIADIQSMPEVDSASFDTVICTQVLEHVPQPSAAMAEISRVLIPGGHAVISVPHLSAIHEAPHDYFRYTSYALRRMAEDAGLQVVSISATGGLISFIAHGVSAALMAVAAFLKPLFWPLWAVNYLTLVRAAVILDQVFGLKNRYPCDYVLVAQKVEA